MCVGTQGQREHYTCSVGGRVHVKTLEHSFSGALSYAQASFLGHMMSSRVREEDVGSCSDECVNFTVGWDVGMYHPYSSLVFNSVNLA